MRWYGCGAALVGNVVEPQALITVSGIVVMAVWAASVLAAIFTYQYQPMEVTTPVMVIYAGFIFASARSIANRSNDVTRKEDN